MGIHLADQTLSFLCAVLLGAALGALYDVFRIIRVAFPCRRGAIFAQDVFFFLLCAVATFLYLLTVIDGAVRVFLILGELIGAALYYYTLGRLVMRVAGAIIETVRAVIRFLIRYIFLPIWRLAYNLVALMLGPARFLCQIAKKSLQRFKFRLKVRRIVLYNQLTGMSRRRASKRREKRRDGTGAEKEKES